MVTERDISLTGPSRTDKIERIVYRINRMIRGCSRMSTESFGNKIKQLREDREITQAQLSDMMMVSRSTIANWETGIRLPDVSMLARLARCLEVEPWVLMDFLEDSEEVPAVIIVDDMPLILSASLRMLSAALPEAEVFGFGNADEALAFARNRRVSVAFLDIELGGKDGVQLARELTALNSYLNVIFLTSHTEYMQDALEEHCSGYILKPLTPEKIRCEISHLRYPVRGLKE